MKAQHLSWKAIQLIYLIYLVVPCVYILKQCVFLTDVVLNETTLNILFGI